MRNRNIFGGKGRRLSGTSCSVGYQVPYRLKDLDKIKELSREAKVRLDFLQFAKDHPVTVTCRRFGISRATYYRWKERYNPKHLESLENRSKRPKNVRKPKWTWQLVEKVRELREYHPAWGKAKLAVLLQREKEDVSESTIGRILRYLRNRGVLKEPVKKVKAAKSPRKRTYAVRKPRDYEVRAPGDIVQIDTLDVRPDPGRVYKQFSAVDMVSKYAFGDIRSAATSLLAKEFLEQLVAKAPFPVKAVQTDGGSEFYGDFEQACEELGIQFFCLPPRSPKLNGGVERLNRTVREEFWAYYEGAGILEEMRPALQEWLAKEYNRLRPHQALGYMTPAEFLEKQRVSECLA